MGKIEISINDNSIDKEYPCRLHIENPVAGDYAYAKLNIDELKQLNANIQRILYNV
ncbi:MAG: hypothetical protein ABIP54_02110 [Candidatus Andersenbacteria bacterium]